MRKDFERVKMKVHVEDVAYHLLGEPVRGMFRFPGERTPSIKVYPETNSFFDFGRGVGGDSVKLWAHIRRCDSWDALKEIKALYGIMDTPDKESARKRIKHQEKERRRQEERKQEFENALFGEVDRLKHWADIFRMALEKRLYEPFSDMWAYCVNELQGIEYKLDILCASDLKTYRRMKPKPGLGLGSDRPQWLLDALSILEEAGLFQAAEDELMEIKAQRDFELLERMPGKDRVCSIEWIRKVLRNKYEPVKKGGESKRKQKKQNRDERWTELSQILNFQPTETEK